MSKKLWTGFVAVYITLIVTMMIIHMGLLGPLYQTPEVARIMRPPSDGLMWIYFVTSAVIAFFFTLIFSKGYTGKGIGEGVRFGLYAGLLMSTPMAYDSYASYPLPYTLALQWFIYGLLQFIVCGIVVAMVFGKPATAPRPPIMKETAASAAP